MKSSSSPYFTSIKKSASNCLSTKQSLVPLTSLHTLIRYAISKVFHIKQANYIPFITEVNTSVGQQATNTTEQTAKQALPGTTKQHNCNYRVT